MSSAKPSAEECLACNGLTGKAGRADDSLYLGDLGPFCDDCYYVAEIAYRAAELAAEERGREAGLEEAAKWHNESIVLYENLAAQMSREGNDTGYAEMSMLRQEHAASRDKCRALSEGK